MPTYSPCWSPHGPYKGIRWTSWPLYPICEKGSDPGWNRFPYIPYDLPIPNMTMNQRVELMDNLQTHGLAAAKSTGNPYAIAAAQTGNFIWDWYSGGEDKAMAFVENEMRGMGLGFLANVIETPHQTENRRRCKSWYGYLNDMIGIMSANLDPSQPSWAEPPGDGTHKSQSWAYNRLISEFFDQPANVAKYPCRMLAKIVVYHGYTLSWLNSRNAGHTRPVKYPGHPAY